MASYPASLETILDLTLIETTASQRWILTAMQQHGSALVSMLWRILGNEQDVCDVYQETFLRLAHMEGRSRPDNVRAYLFRTASNTAISLLRREQLKTHYQQQLRTHFKPDSKDPAGDLDAKDLQQQLRDAIAKLPDYLGDVVVLRDLAEMPYEQVAKILGINPTAARVYRHKALKLLAGWMSESEK